MVNGRSDLRKPQRELLSYYSAVPSHENNVVNARRTRPPRPLAVLLLLAGVSLLASLMLGWPASPAGSTGDELLDAVLRILDGPQPQSIVDHPTFAPTYSRFRELVPKFGDDSRFWELRYALGDGGMSHATQRELFSRGLFTGAWHLEEARRRGITSPALNLATLVEYGNAAKYRGADWHLLDEYLSDGSVLAEFEKLGEALPFYYLAGLAAGRSGKLDEALALIKRGNALPHCTMLRCFPFSETSRYMTPEQTAGHIGAIEELNDKSGSQLPEVLLAPPLGSFSSPPTPRDLDYLAAANRAKVRLAAMKDYSRAQ